MTALDKKTPITVDSAKEALRVHASRIDYNPQTNSVFAFAGELFQQLEDGDTDIETLGTLVQEIFVDLIEARAERFSAQHKSVGSGAWAGARAQLKAIAGKGWDDFRAQLETPYGGIVFTAHPTFALSKVTRDRLAAHVTKPSDATDKDLRESLSEDGRDWSRQISLSGEHDEAQAAITHAQAALNAYAGLIYDTAAELFPDTWQTLRPSLPTVASWIGYDLDGRTDIHWSQSFALRLREKATQLQRYAAQTSALVDAASGAAKASLSALHDQLQAAADLTDTEATVFAGDLTDPDTLVEAANILTSPNAARLVSAKPILSALDEIVGSGLDDAELAKGILVLRAQIEALQLGTARIHLRLNAAQIGTVISRDLGLETENRDLGRSALNKLSDLAAHSEKLSVNFADLFLEQSTARRQFMMCAQFLKHIDADSTIRFLIAESENPATVMGALYMARQYGVDQQLDISPLFETPEALETAGRFIEQLLSEREYMKYVRGRGYLSVQLGFSDAGRFIGQVSADMAIERIHNLISRALSEADEDGDLALLIFNTHGESMGRGAYPGTFKQRFDHLLTHWTRRQSRKRGVALRHEVSFQGGDGFLHFANTDLASSTYAAFAEHLLSEPEPKGDPFYTRTDLVWDFYRALRLWHERLFSNEDYAHLLSDFATNFLVKAGSRERRRASGPAGPRSLRAISHNATLQQLGIPLNTAAGIGSALRREQDQVNDLIKDSPRMRGLIRLASIARAHMSVPVLRAYGSVFDPSFWVSLSRADQSERSLSYRRIYYLLQDRQTTTSIEKIANSLSIDLSKFDPMLARMDKAPTPQARHEARLDVHVLHAIRQALMMKALSLAGRLPAVSRRHSQGVVDIMRMIKAMEIGSAVEVLCRIFPASRANEARLKAVTEPGHMTGNPANGYDQIHAEIIQPLDQIDRQLHAITLAVCQAYGAYG